MDVPPPPILSGLREIADRYDGYLLDLWGTIHDGVRPLPGVLDAMAALKARGARLLILSNAPRRNRAVIARMAKMGIGDELYDAVLSSGEDAHRALRDRSDPWHARLGRVCYHLGPPRDASVYEGLDLELVADVDRADFILATGIDEPDETVADYEPVLAAGATRRVPMVCANPDLVVLRGDVPEVCAGALADRYAELGGEVYYHGKPHPAIYDAALALLGIGDRARVAAVGDSLRTDIAGARAIGIDTVFIPGGIHAEALGHQADVAPDRARLQALFDEAGVIPTFVLPAFVW
jgi:HAD superfamily hydrolase (TIGR01459 family)